MINVTEESCDVNAVMRKMKIFFFVNPRNPQIYCILPSAISVFGWQVRWQLYTDYTLKFVYVCHSCCLCLIIELAREMNFTVDEINHIRLENPNSLTAQSFMLLKKWVSREGKNATSKTIFISQNLIFRSPFSFTIVFFCFLLLSFSALYLKVNIHHLL